MAADTAGSPHCSSMIGTAASDGICTHDDTTTRVHAVQPQTLVNRAECDRIAAPDVEVVRNLQRNGVCDFDTLVLDIAGHELRQRLHIRRNHRDATAPSVFNPSTSAPALVTTGAGCAFALGDLVQTLLRFAVIAVPHAHDCDKARVAKDVDRRVRRAPRRSGRNRRPLPPAPLS